MTGPYVQYRVLEVKITGFFFLVTSCEENLVILNLLNPLAVVPAKTHRTRPHYLLSRTNVALIVGCEHCVESPSNFVIQ